MKIRNGFVSNSSSSSFVVFGVPGITIEQMRHIMVNHLDMTQEEVDAIPDEDVRWTFRDKSPYAIGDDYFGKYLAEVDGEYIASASFSIDDLNAIADKLTKLGLPRSEMKLIMGTESC